MSRPEPNTVLGRLYRSLLSSHPPSDFQEEADEEGAEDAPKELAVGATDFLQGLRVGNQIHLVISHKNLSPPAW